MITLDVPYQSQESLETTNQRRWCGLASLWMVMSYYLNDQAPTAQELVTKYGKEFEAGGFQHQFLLSIARDYKLRGFRKSWWAKPGSDQLIEKFKSEGESGVDILDWDQTNINESFHSTRDSINKKQPVIVSVSPEFSQSKSTHLVVIIGYQDDQFIIHDPFTNGENYQISQNDLEKFWLRQSIFIKND